MNREVISSYAINADIWVSLLYMIWICSFSQNEALILGNQMKLTILVPIAKLLTQRICVDVSCNDLYLHIIFYEISGDSTLNDYSLNHFYYETNYHSDVWWYSKMNWKCRLQNFSQSVQVLTWWRHQMEPFSALLALRAGNSPVTGEFPSQRPVAWSFGVVFHLRLNKRLSKQSWGWWFETPSHPLWRHCNVC